MNGKRRKNIDYTCFCISFVNYEWQCCIFQKSKLTVLKPLYIIRISCLVNLVSLQRSSKATGTGLGTLLGSISYTTSSTGLSDGVAIIPPPPLLTVQNHDQLHRTVALSLQFILFIRENSASGRKYLHLH